MITDEAIRYVVAAEHRDLCGCRTPHCPTEFAIDRAVRSGANLSSARIHDLEAMLRSVVVEIGLTDWCFPIVTRIEALLVGRPVPP